jgi:hypothetical protein
MSMAHAGPTVAAWLSLNAEFDRLCAQCFIGINVA